MNADLNIPRPNYSLASIYVPNAAEEEQLSDSLASSSGVPMYTPGVVPILCFAFIKSSSAAHLVPPRSLRCDMNERH